MFHRLRPMNILLLPLYVLMLAAWPWGVFLYAREENIAGIIGALVVIPIGALHGIGAF